MEPPVEGLEPGRHVELPGRGRTWVRDLPGPPGAPAVLLLHGWTATADINWASSYRALQARFRVVALDHHGHGRGLRAPRRPFRLPDCADDAAAVCEVLGIERVVVAGYSMGGPIAQLAWRRHRDLVAGLVLCATAARFTDGSPRVRALSAGMVGAAMAARVGTPVLGVPLARRYASTKVGPDPAMRWAAEQISRHDLATVLQAGPALTAFDSRAWIGGVDVPTAVVVTELDTLVPSSRQRELAALVPGARLFAIPASHGAPVEQHRVFVPAVVAAVSDVWARAAGGVDEAPAPAP